jgi:hypothetical protein
VAFDVEASALTKEAWIARVGLGFERTTPCSLPGVEEHDEARIPINARVDNMNVDNAG